MFLHRLIFLATLLAPVVSDVIDGPPGPPLPPACEQDCSLTAGDIDDNLNFVTYEIYKKKTYDADTPEDDLGEGAQITLPNPDLSDRLSVTVKDNQGNGFSCATVEVSGVELSAGSDGKLAFFSEIDDLPARPWMVTPLSPDRKIVGASMEVTTVDDSIELVLNSNSTLPTEMDLAVVLDTTGSMCDEISFLQDELATVISSFTGKASGNRLIDLKVAMVYYKDVGDEYIASTSGFSSPDTALAELAAEFCNGGGDYPEAVHTAWEVAGTLDWRTGNVARVALLIGDAPPHRADIAAALEAAKILRIQGVRMYGLAASGVNSVLEYLLRMVALLSNGRHMWLTSDSLIGNEKADAKVPCFQVTNMEDLLTRVLLGELEGKRFEPDAADIVREVGNQTAGICLIDLNDPEASLSATGNDGGGGGLGVAGGDSLASIPEFVPAPTPAPPTICFPGDQTVEVLGHGLITMNSLKLGDMISVGRGEYAKVFSFGHYDSNVKAGYLQIHARHLEQPLEISNDHMVFVEKDSYEKAVPASAVALGDKLVLASGGSVVVTKILTVERTGAFAPFTTSGKVAVNGVVVSSYVSLQEKSDVLMIGDIRTPVSMHWLAHAFQAPHRAVCTMAWSYCERETYTAEGLSHWVNTSLWVSKWFLSQNTAVLALGSIFVLAASLICVSVELIIVYPWVLIAAYVAFASFRRHTKTIVT
eukprot:CAMPEP_0119004112 /NCGR_PEP_ID=MMETSP1176-20130426/959_1 /TAXON_ID=265551 /ORGANISM="Synedropsis recta cf, Strain CCMP1620" /LENGTH=703 /DNA_ID=CAMNT_0006955785 /DNA_START=61 /DNA_END=2172 /DNA_ORIENTATION=-